MARLGGENSVIEDRFVYLNEDTGEEEPIAPPPRSTLQPITAPRPPAPPPAAPAIDVVTSWHNRRTGEVTKTMRGGSPPDGSGDWETFGAWQNRDPAGYAKAAAGQGGGTPAPPPVAASPAPAPPAAQGPYDAFNKAFRGAFGRDITQEQLNDNAFLQTLGNDLFRLLPVDRQVGFSSARIAELSNQDAWPVLKKLAEINPQGFVTAFPTSFWRRFDNDKIAKDFLPLFSQHNPTEAANIIRQNGIGGANAGALPPEQRPGLPGGLPGAPSTGTPSAPPPAAGTPPPEPRQPSPAPFVDYGTEVGADVRARFALPRLQNFGPPARGQQSDTSTGYDPTGLYLALSGLGGAAPPVRDNTESIGRPAQGYPPPVADTRARLHSANPYEAYARQAAEQAGIDPDIFSRQIRQESGFNPNAKSPAGAIGIAQIMPATAQGWGVDPTDPYASLDAAARAMAKYVKDYGGDYRMALAAYNAGPGAVAKYGGVPPFEETQRYLTSILGPDGGQQNPNVIIDAEGNEIPTGSGKTPPGEPQPPFPAQPGMRWKRSIKTDRYGDSYVDWEEVSMPQGPNPVDDAYKRAQTDDLARRAAQNEQQLALEREKFREALAQNDRQAQVAIQERLDRLSREAEQLAYNRERLGLEGELGRAGSARADLEANLRRADVTGFYGYAPTLERETAIGASDRANAQLNSDRAFKAAEVALSHGNQLEAQRQFNLGQQLRERAQGFTEEIGRGQLGLSTEIQRGQLGLATRSQEEAERQGGFGRELEAARFRREVEQSPASFAQRAYAARGQQAPPPVSGPAAPPAVSFAPSQAAPPPVDRVGPIPDRYPQWQPIGGAVPGRDETEYIGRPAVTAPPATARLHNVPPPARNQYAAPAQQSFATTLNPLTAAEIKANVGPGLANTLEGKAPGQFFSEVPRLSAQRFGQLLPSERKEYGAAALASGTDPDDLMEEIRRRSQTGTPPPAVTTRTRRAPRAALY